MYGYITVCSFMLFPTKPQELFQFRNTQLALRTLRGPQVYDVTNFAKIHPGGPGRIQMAGGSDLQKYFDVARPDISRFGDCAVLDDGMAVLEILEISESCLS